MADIPESTKSEHVSWTVNATSYLRNLDSEDLDAETIAVHYQKAPEKTETGTRISLCFPTLIVSGYCSEPREVADRVARILNAHWDEPAAPPAMDREAAYRQALEDVCNPLGYLQRMADAEGAKLSGMAYAIASDIGTIQRIAKEALSTLSADAIRQGEGFVRMVSRLTHSGDDGWTPDDADDATQTLDGLIAKARTTISGHTVDCAWHVDQYPHECTCAPATPATPASHASHASHASDGGKA